VSSAPVAGPSNKRAESSEPSCGCLCMRKSSVDIPKMNWCCFVWLVAHRWGEDMVSWSTLDGSEGFKINKYLEPIEAAHEVFVVLGLSRESRLDC
jgi:hypothetical protein